MEANSEPLEQSHLTVQNKPTSEDEPKRNKLLDFNNSNNFIKLNLKNKKELQKKLLSFDISKNFEDFFWLTIRPKAKNENGDLLKSKFDPMVTKSRPSQVCEDKNKRKAVLVDLNRQTMDTMRVSNNSRCKYYENYMLNKRLANNATNINYSNSSNTLSKINLSIPETVAHFLPNSDLIEVNKARFLKDKLDLLESSRQKQEEHTLATKYIKNNIHDDQKKDFNSNEILQTQFRLKPLSFTSKNVKGEETREKTDKTKEKRPNPKFQKLNEVGFKFNLAKSCNSKTKLEKLNALQQDQLTLKSFFSEPSDKASFEAPESNRNYELSSSSTEFVVKSELNLGKMQNEQFECVRMESPLRKSMPNAYKFVASSSVQLSSNVNARLNQHFELYQSHFYDQQRKNNSPNLF